MSKVAERVSPEEEALRQIPSWGLDKRFTTLLRCYGRLIEALKGYKPDDPRLLDCHGLAVRLFLQSATLYHLTKGTDLTPFLPFEGHAVDLASVVVVCRSIIESYLTFSYVFVKSTGDEFDFRYAAWRLSGHAQRAEFPYTNQEYASKASQERIEAQTYQEAVKATARFADLKPRTQAQILAGKKWMLGSWSDLAEETGIARRYFSHIYSFLSEYAHSGALSSWQVAAAGPADQPELARTELQLAEMFIARMILDYCRIFPPLQSILAEDIPAKLLAQIDSAILERLDQFSDMTSPSDTDIESI